MSGHEPRTFLINKTRAKLAKRELCIGLSLRMVRHIDIGRLLETADFDFGFIDQEHAGFSLDMSGFLSTAMQDIGVTPMVRVPSLEPYHAGKALDMGAMGIFFPGVETVEQARHCVNICKFPPQGERSVASTPQVAFRGVHIGEATAIANRETLVVLMLESPAAVARANDIAAVPGVDVLLLGANDLGMALGLPAQPEHPQLHALFEQAIGACLNNGITAGFGGIYEEPAMRRYIQMGARFILSGNDIGMLLAGMQQRANMLRGISIA
ncbi:MAG: 2-keto-3-deoxy-L-rhamnonate aldolase RhmA [Gammaproteobacteria bacterium]|jgi:2-keto-3-deoxy-L-rhamnonate aldolase RhmA